jgi:hypothetical protein
MVIAYVYHEVHMQCTHVVEENKLHAVNFSMSLWIKSRQLSLFSSEPIRSDIRNKEDVDVRNMALIATEAWIGTSDPSPAGNSVLLPERVAFIGVQNRTIRYWAQSSPKTRPKAGILLLADSRSRRFWVGSGGCKLALVQETVAPASSRGSIERKLAIWRWRPPNWSEAADLGSL